MWEEPPRDCDTIPEVESLTEQKAEELPASIPLLPDCRSDVSSRLTPLPSCLPRHGILTRSVSKRSASLLKLLLLGILSEQ